MARDPSTNRFAAQNRRARYDYAIGDTVDAGMVLTGTEVKSLRLGRASINEAFAAEKDGEFWLFNSYFPEYESANRFNHEPRRPRKLLLKRREIKKLLGQTQRQGMTLIPLSIYFNDRGIAKMQLGLAHGKRKADKRAAEKEKDWKRDQQRLIRTRGRDSE
jgi:SsrA-binding protein